MIEFEYKKPFATIDGTTYEIYWYEISSSIGVSIAMRNGEYNWGTTVLENQTTINGVLQTSVQMIIDTLSNG